MKKSVCLFLVILFTSCGIFKKKDREEPKKSENNKEVSPLSILENVKVQKHQLGEFNIGNPVIQSDVKTWQAFDQRQVNAGFFGFDGGGNASLFSFKDQPVFALLKDENDIIKAIIAIYPAIQTKENISVQSSFQQIKTTYPQGILKNDPMNKWSIYNIPSKNWQFIFDVRLDDLQEKDVARFLIIR